MKSFSPWQRHQFRQTDGAESKFSRSNFQEIAKRPRFSFFLFLFFLFFFFFGL